MAVKLEQLIRKYGTRLMHLNAGYIVEFLKLVEKTGLVIKRY